MGSFLEIAPFSLGDRLTAPAVKHAVYTGAFHWTLTARVVSLLVCAVMPLVFEYSNLC